MRKPILPSEREPRDPHAFHVPDSCTPYVEILSVSMLWLTSIEEADAAAAAAVPGTVCVIGLQGPWQFHSDELNKIPLKGRTVYLAFEPGGPEPTPQHVLGWKLRHRGARVFSACEEAAGSEPTSRSFRSPFESKDDRRRRWRRAR